MKKLSQITAVILSIVLLGQTYIFAQDTVSLKDVQAQAKEDANILSDPGFIIGGISTALLVYTTYSFVKADGKIAELTKQLESTQQEIIQLQKDKKFLTNRAKGLEKGYNIARSKVINQELAYKQTIAELQQNVIAYANHIESYANFSEINSAALDRYLSLFSQKVSPETKSALRAELAQESWVRAFSKQERQDFLKLIDTMIEHSSMPSMTKDGILAIFNIVNHNFMKRHMAAPNKYLLALYQKIFMKRNIVLMGLVTVGTISASAADNHDSQVAKRLANNINLFLNANEQELQTIENNPQAYEIAMQHAAVLHELAQLPKSQLNSLRDFTHQRPTLKIRSAHAR